MIKELTSSVPNSKAELCKPFCFSVSIALSELSHWAVSQAIHLYMVCSYTNKNVHSQPLLQNCRCCLWVHESLKEFFAPRIELLTILWIVSCGIYNWRGEERTMLRGSGKKKLVINNTLHFAQTYSFMYKHDYQLVLCAIQFWFFSFIKYFWKDR